MKEFLNCNFNKRMGISDKLIGENVHIYTLAKLPI